MEGSFIKRPQVLGQELFSSRATQYWVAPASLVVFGLCTSTPQIQQQQNGKYRYGESWTDASGHMSANPVLTSENNMLINPFVLLDQPGPLSMLPWTSSPPSVPSETTIRKPLHQCVPIDQNANI